MKRYETAPIGPCNLDACGFRYGDVGDQPRPALLLLAEPRHAEQVAFLQTLTADAGDLLHSPSRNDILAHALIAIGGAVRQSDVSEGRVDPFLYQPLLPLAKRGNDEFAYDPNVAGSIWNRLVERVELEKVGALHLIVGRAGRLAWAGDVWDLEQGLELHLPPSEEAHAFLVALKDATAQVMEYSPAQSYAMAFAAAYGGVAPENRVLRPAPGCAELQELLLSLAAQHGFTPQPMREKPGRLPMIAKAGRFSRPMFLQWMFDLGYRCAVDDLHFPGFKPAAGRSILHWEGRRVELVDAHTGMLRFALGQRYARGDLRKCDLDTIKRNRIRLPKGTRPDAVAAPLGLDESAKPDRRIRIGSKGTAKPKAQGPAFLELGNALSGGLWPERHARDTRTGNAVVYAVEPSPGRAEGRADQVQALQYLSEKLGTQESVEAPLEVAQFGDCWYYLTPCYESPETVFGTHRVESVSEALAWFGDVLAGIGHVHAAGIVHGDLHRGRFVRVGTAGWTVRGLVEMALRYPHRVCPQLRKAATNKRGEVIHAMYAAPEFLQGAQPTVQADLYSLGILLYELLEGRLPFTCDTPLGYAISHVREPMPPLSAANAALQPLIDSLTAKDPAGRPADAGSIQLPQWFDP